MFILLVPTMAYITIRSNNKMIIEHARHNEHNGVLHTIVTRNTWQEFRFLLRGLKQFSQGYEKCNDVAVDYKLFKYMVDGVVVDDTESKELYFYCINRGVI